MRRFHSLLLAVVLGALAAGCSGKGDKGDKGDKEGGRSADDDKNLEQLKAWGNEGKVRWMKDEDHGGESWIVAASGVPDALPLLKSVPNMTSLTVFGYAGDEVMQHIGKLKGLRVLSLELQGHSGEKTVKGLTDAGLVHLKGLEKLEKLYLRRCHDFSPEMKGLASLAGLPALKELVMDAGYTDASLEHLKECKQIAKLNLGGVDLSDKGVKSLLELSGLEELEVSVVELQRKDVVKTDWIPELQKLPKLKVLTIHSPINPFAVQEPVEKLKKARPDIKVEIKD
jgi:hypothetical protein